MLSHYLFNYQNELEVSSQQKKSAVSDFFKFSANQVSSQRNEVRSQ